MKPLPAKRTSLSRTVAAPVPSTTDRAAGNREKPRNTCADGVAAARTTASVQTFGYRTARRQKASDSDARSLKRASSRFTSWISYAFENRAITRHENGEKKAGIAAISTRHRRPESAGAVSTSIRSRGQTSTTPVRGRSPGQGGGSV